MPWNHIRSRVRAQDLSNKMWCTKPWSVYNRAQRFVKTKSKREANLVNRFNYLIKGNTQMCKHFPLRGYRCPGDSVCIVFGIWPSSLTFHFCSWAPDPHHPHILCHSCSRSLDMVLPLCGLSPIGVFAELVLLPGTLVPHFFFLSYSSNSPPLWHLSPPLITSTN